ncbi:MAG: diaminopimelate decarboxylase [Pseudomonadota bacterium]
MLPSVTENPIYRDDPLLRTLADTYGTPFYVFDEALIRAKCRALLADVTYRPFNPRYALKALTLRGVLEVIKDEGYWADASSVNEVKRALRAGFTKDQVYYTGEGGSDADYRWLVDQGILINCTSLDQIRRFARVGGTQCSIRINPGEGHGESDKTNTGGPDSKHGIYFDQIGEVQDLVTRLGVRIVGLHSHIGSGGNDLREWLRVSEPTFGFAAAFPDIETLNLGGGIPVNYGEANIHAMSQAEWGAALSARMARFAEGRARPIALQLEPGRVLVAAAGLLVAEVEAVKRTAETHGQAGRSYVVVNTGLNHNPRPALYGSYHPMRVVPQTGQTDQTAEHVIAGNLCESGDILTFAKDGRIAERAIGEAAEGDLLVIAGSGAYTQSMKSEYNSMNTPPSVLVGADGVHRLIERRGTFEDTVAREV